MRALAARLLDEFGTCLNESFCLTSTDLNAFLCLPTAAAALRIATLLSPHLVARLCVTYVTVVACSLPLHNAVFALRFCHCCACVCMCVCVDTCLSAFV